MNPKPSCVPGGAKGGGVEDKREHKIQRSEAEGSENTINVAEEWERSGDEGGEHNVCRSQKETR